MVEDEPVVPGEVPGLRWAGTQQARGHGVALNGLALRGRLVGHLPLMGWSLLAPGQPRGMAADPNDMGLTRQEARPAGVALLPAVQSTVWILTGLAGLYVVLAAVQFAQLAGPSRLVMTCSAVASCLVLGLTAGLVVRRVRRGEPAPAWVEAYALVPLGNGLLRLGLTGDVHQTTTIMLTLVAAGAAVASTRIALVVVLAGVAGWIAVVASRPSLHATELPHVAAELAVAVCLAGLLHAALRRRERHLRLARDELATIAHHFRGIFDDSPLGIGVADTEGRFVAVNPAFCRLVGRPAGELLGVSDLAYTHEEDRDGHGRTGLLIDTAREGVAHVEKRYVRPDGSVRWAWLSLTHVDPTTDTPGPWTLAHVQDVTTRHEAERALRDSEQNLATVTSVARRIRQGEDARTSIVAALHSLADADTAALVEVSADHVDTLVISAAAGFDGVGTLIPLDASSVTAQVYREGRSVFLADPSDDPHVSRSLLAMSNPRSLVFQPVLIRGRTTAVICVTWKERVESSDDRRARAVALLADETALALDHERLLKELERVAHTDQLTGLWNRRAWDMRLPEFMANARRQRSLLTVAIADLDHFKEYNDVHGHPAGDEMLRRTAQAFAGAVRLGDLVTRWGGEEFAFALADCPPADAGTVLDRVRTAMPEGQTCSIGYALWNGVETPEELLARADAALYEAKRTGRNRATEAAGLLLQ